MTFAKRIVLILIVLVACVGCDQTTKSMAKSCLSDVKSLSLLGDSIRLQLVYNKGAFLSFGASLPATWRTVFFSFGVGVVLLGLLGYTVLSKSALPAHIFALALLCAGGIGNLIDRLRYGGYVVDFLNIGIGSLRSGIFNVADIAVVFGVLVFAVMRISEHSTPSVRPSL